MNLGTIILVTVVAAGVVLLVWVALTFNSFVRLGNRVEEAFSGIDVQLKRRHDLVSNLVKVVQAYARHERETLETVVSARGAAVNAGSLAARQTSENGLSHSIARLLALVENYPDLKADRNFRQLHHDLVELEDHLQYARRYYNGSVRDYNTRIEQFPVNLLAPVFQMRNREFFELESPAERQAPDIAMEPPS
jgi:LemA protein